MGFFRWSWLGIPISWLPSAGAVICERGSTPHRLPNVHACSSVPRLSSDGEWEDVASGQGCPFLGPCAETAGVDERSCSCHDAIATGHVPVPILRSTFELAWQNSVPVRTGMDSDLRQVIAVSPIRQYSASPPQLVLISTIHNIFAPIKHSPLFGGPLLRAAQYSHPFTFYLSPPREPGVRVCLSPLTPKRKYA